MENLFEKEPQILKQIIHRYIFQAERLPASRFYHSKISAAILFYHYARYSGDHRYTDFANDLMEQISGNISFDSPVNFGYGLSGMAWGVYYLINEGFVEGDVNDILTEVDLHIMERDLNRINDTSFDTGIAGILFYVDSRLRYASCKNTSLPFDEKYLRDIQVIKKQTDVGHLSVNDILLKLWLSMKYIFNNS